MSENSLRGVPWCLRGAAAQTTTAAPPPRCRSGPRSRLCHNHPSHPVFLANVTSAHALEPYYARIQILGRRVFLVRGSSNSSNAKFGLPPEAFGPVRDYLTTLAALASTFDDTPDVDFVLNPCLLYTSPSPRDS